MTTIIKDGNSGYTAKVNAENRLFTNTVQITADSDATLKGKAFVTNTTNMTLTSDSASAIYYLKNNEAEDMITSRFSLSVSESTGGSGRMLFEIIRNPTTGTIIDTATSTTFSNRNFGSSNVLVSDSYEGDEGKTLTNGTIYSNTLFAVNTSILVTITIVIPRGSSIGFRVTPPTGNTSLSVIAGINVHLDGFND